MVDVHGCVLGGVEVDSDLATRLPTVCISRNTEPARLDVCGLGSAFVNHQTCRLHRREIFRGAQAVRAVRVPAAALGRDPWPVGGPELFSHLALVVESTLVVVAVSTLLIR